MRASTEIQSIGRKARAAAREVAVLGTEAKNAALERVGEAILEARSVIRAANHEDLEAGRAAGLTGAMLDRLELSDARIYAMAEGVAHVARLSDPVGAVLSSSTRPNGLELSRIRVPIGVVAIIFESRPNVTADAASLCLKSGNASILRGGREAIRSNSAIANVFSKALGKAGLNPEAVQLVRSTDHAAVGELLSMDRYVDVVIPRGGKSLIERVVEEARMPVIKHYEGICHLFVDQDADPEMALSLAVNAKCQRPGVCNAMETLILHERAPGALGILNALRDAGVDLVGDDGARALAPWVGEATEDDWRMEYLALKLSVKTVAGLNEAIAHINEYGSGHTDAIVTRDEAAAGRFVREVDSACVFVNCSTRFSDGFQFGLGAEIGISTDRIHARGPMGLEELCTYKWVARGTGQLRS